MWSVVSFPARDQALTHEKTPAGLWAVRGSRVRRSLSSSASNAPRKYEGGQLGHAEDASAFRVVTSTLRDCTPEWWTWHDCAVTTPQVPARLVFRIPATAVLAALLLAVAATPFAFAAPLLFLIYLVPIGAIVWVLRLRTVADAEGLVARTLFGRHVLRWGDIRALRVSERSWVRAVLEDDREQTLPTVRTRHLPALALISGGRLADPTEPADPPTDSDAQQEEADQAK